MSARLQWPDDEPRLRLALSQAYRDRPFGVRRGGVLWKEAHAWSADALNATAAKVLADAAACDAGSLKTTVRNQQFRFAERQRATSLLELRREHAFDPGVAAHVPSAPERADSARDFFATRRGLN